MARATRKAVKLDRLDLRILTEVAARARQTIKELSKTVGLSASPCAARLEQLEADGIILGHQADIDLERLADLSLYYVTVAGKPWTLALAQKLEALMLENPYIVAADHLFGSIDYLLRVYARSTQHFHEIMAPFVELQVDYETWPVSRCVMRQQVHRLVDEIAHDQQIEIANRRSRNVQRPTGQAGQRDDKVVRAGKVRDTK
jgi:Lrp/AsnC family transcriptional regulator, regulator of ectoine-degradation genes